MPPLSELYLATILKRNNIPIVFMDADMQPDEFSKLVSGGFEGLKCAVMMVSTQSFRNDVLFLESLKSKRPDAVTVLYGAHPTFMPEYCVEPEAVDYIVLGEPERTVEELVERIMQGRSAEDVMGIGFKTGDGVRISERRPFIDLDTLPVPDRGLLPAGIDYFNPVVRRVPYTTAQTSRGCPHRCIFCTSPAFYGNKLRFRSTESVMEELREIERMGYKEVFFRDETFTAFKRRNTEICESIIRENLDMVWIANARADDVDLETLQLMKRAGCHMLKFGVESGSDELLDSYRKDITTEQSAQAMELARKAGIETHAHVVFGGPGETAETIEKTIRFVIKIAPTTATFGILTPYPGSELFDRVAAVKPEIRDGAELTMSKIHTFGFYSETICGLSGRFLMEKCGEAYRRFYMRPGYLLGMLRNVTDSGNFFRFAIAGTNVIQFAMTGRK